MCSLRCRLGIDDAIESSIDVAPAFSVPRINPGAALVIVPLFVLPFLVLICACRGRVKTMPKDVSQDDPSLPFPGEYGPNGFATQYIKLDQKVGSTGWLGQTRPDPTAIIICANNDTSSTANWSLSITCLPYS
ncbi:hypothetical protein C8R44DRAFT_976463 [Mycena epipterygia]|nr:hypothetical protein C8R44DRAFT_976463 [Mycena epipterygia]